MNTVYDKQFSHKSSWNLGKKRHGVHFFTSIPNKNIGHGAEVIKNSQFVGIPYTFAVLVFDVFGACV